MTVKTSHSETPRAETLRVLRQLCRRTPVLVPSDERPRYSTGIPSLDALLPNGGVEHGSLVEWIVPVAGCGAGVLALQSVKAVLSQRAMWAVVDPAGEFHPSAAVGWGVSRDSLLVLRPASIPDAVWAMEQCLRCPAIGVTWFLSEQIPDRILQRWKLAAETGGGLGMVFRPAEAARRASWADVRWQVHPRPSVEREGRRVRIELLACRGAFTDGSVELDVHDATGDVSLVSSLVGATTANRAAGA